MTGKTNISRIIMLIALTTAAYHQGSSFQAILTSLADTWQNKYILYTVLPLAAAYIELLFAKYSSYRHYDEASTRYISGSYELFLAVAILSHPCLCR